MSGASPSELQGVNPMDTIAFKMTLEEQIRKTKVINVEWNITRHGRYFPKVIFNAVYIEGIRITRSAAHNANHIRGWNMGRGTEDYLPPLDDLPPLEDDLPHLNPYTRPSGSRHVSFVKSKREFLRK